MGLWRTLKCVSMNTCLPCLKSQPMNLGKLSSTTTPRWSIRMRKSIFLRWVLIPIWTHWNLWRTTLSQVSWLSCWSSYSSQYYNNSVVIWIIIITFWIFIFILNIWNPNSEYLNFKHSHIMWMFEYLNMWMFEYLNMSMFEYPNSEYEHLNNIQIYYVNVWISESNSEYIFFSDYLNSDYEYPILRIFKKPHELKIIPPSSSFVQSLAIRTVGLFCPGFGGHECHRLGV